MPSSPNCEKTFSSCAATGSVGAVSRRSRKIRARVTASLSSRSSTGAVAASCAARTRPRMLRFQRSDDGMALLGPAG